MRPNKLVVVITFIGLVIIITLGTYIKLRENKINKSYNFIIDNIVYYSKKCVNEKKCQKTTITLKELYDLEYVKKQINPKTNKYFNEKSYIKVIDYEFILVE